MVPILQRMTRTRPVAGLMLACATTAMGQPLGPKPTLHTPDVIAPAVLPYLACLYAERGLPLLHATDGTRVPYERGGSGCSAARARAIADAAKLLEKNPPPAGTSAAAFIEGTLTDMDRYVASLPVSDGADARSQSAVIGIPVTIEDEVQPAYTRYDDCLKTQVSNSRVSADTILAKFREAMTTCASVRAYAVSEATKALSAKGWDEPTRARAAESTFAKVDESWLVMGQQYRQMLLQIVANMAKPAAAATDGKRE